jgi:hypothetical protein
MSKLSRRILLSSVAFTAAAVTPLAASPASPGKQAASDRADAELLRLIPELDQLEARWLAQTQIERARLAAHKAACLAAGLPDKDHDEFECFSDAHAYRRAQAAVDYPGKQEAAADVGKDGESIFWSAYLIRQQAVCNLASKHEPTTLAGLAVRTRAAILENPELWDLYSEGDRAAAFIETVSAFLGFQALPTLLPEA